MLEHSFDLYLKPSMMLSPTMESSDAMSLKRKSSFAMSPSLPSMNKAMRLDTLDTQHSLALQHPLSPLLTPETSLRPMLMPDSSTLSLQESTGSNSNLFQLQSITNDMLTLMDDFNFTSTSSPSFNSTLLQLDTTTPFSSNDTSCSSPRKYSMCSSHSDELNSSINTTKRIPSKAGRKRDAAIDATVQSDKILELSKPELKRIKNTLAARRSRMKKNEQIDALHQQLHALTEEKKHLVDKIQSLEDEKVKHEQRVRDYLYRIKLLESTLTKMWS